MKYLLLIVCCGVLTLVPHSTAQDAGVSGATNRVLSGNGRYVFGQISSFRSDQYMLDTQTGRLWQIQTAGTNTAVELMPIKYNVLISGEWVNSWAPIDEAQAETNRKPPHP